MRIPDVNVLIGAYRADDPRHEDLRHWLREALASREGFGLTPGVATGFVRIVTNPRVYVTPTPLDMALEQVDQLVAFPRTTWLQPGPRHWQIFSRLCREADARGNLASDAAHAAVAIEHGATWVTLDRDFARFPGLRWEVPRLVP